MDNKKKSKLQIPPWGWLIISFLVAMLLWFFLSVNEKTARSFPFLPAIIQALGTVISRGILAEDFISSMISVLAGFALGFVTAVPVAFLMAWYLPVRNILEPWIQFIRNIPPLAYVPLVVIAVGVGRKPQIIVIWLATFLIMTVTIYQGVRNVDETLLKAARVLGAKDKDLFIKVVFPATTPFILTAVRLGVSVALTTLIAAESTGASAGMGMRIRSFSNSFEVAPMLLYIILIGIIGITSEKIIKTLERKLTGWQEKREI
ncbi:ABC transporter permease [Oscillibacter valericigenes]|uniref:ABC transporter permease n=1 Tax=Oscillibacter valericigenes TaxID=351091 RepID=UPI001F209A56|nr:ABC transporter permease [Oscillibacter valericigenes]MCF2663121.1 ABC transporter permease [Oscillibacter valericigenes]